jgi:hypothetical protein
MEFNQLRHQDPATRTFLGSPSLARLPGGGLLATHDYFGPESPGEADGVAGLTTVYRSDDNGQTWRDVRHLTGVFWASLFVHRGSVWLLGCSNVYGSIVIRRSDDGGVTWTYPIDAESGLLFAGGAGKTSPNYHGAPVPVLVQGGRLFRAFEDCTPCVWGRGFQALVISAREDADLLKASSWTMSNKLAFDPGWAPVDRWTGALNPGWLEGNCVAAPDGSIWNILRVNAEPMPDQAALVRVSADGRTVSFNPATGFIDFPGGTHKFTIRRDPRTGLYLSLTNPAAGRFPSGGGIIDVPFLGVSRRNVLTLCSSPDLRKWSVCATLLVDDLPVDEKDSYLKTGFQYVDWIFDGDDILYLVRTGYDGSRNFHDSNRITFHRLRDYAAHLGRPILFKAHVPEPSDEATRAETTPPVFVGGSA